MKIKIFTVLLIIFSISNVYAGYTISEKDLKEKVLINVLNNKTNQKNNSFEVDDILDELDDETKKSFELKLEEINDLSKQSKFQSIEDLDYYLLNNKFKDTSKDDKEDDKEHNIWLTLFLTLFLIDIAVLIFFFKNRKSNKSKKEHFSEFDSNSEMTQPVVKENKTDDPVLHEWKIKYEDSLSDYINSKKVLEDKINTLEEENSKLKTSLAIIDKQNKTEVKPETEVVKQEVIVPVVEKPKVYFAKNINSNGYFEMKDLLDYSNNNEFYKISIDKDNAEFEFYNNKYSLETSLEYINDYIKPFCFETNFKPASVSAIRTIKKGILIKEGNLWKVQSKAEIKYE